MREGTMIREYKTVKLTEEDKKYFAIKKYSKESNKARLKATKAKSNKQLCTITLFSLPAVWGIVWQKSDTIKYISLLCLSAIVFLLVIYIYMRYANIHNVIEKGNYIEVVVLEKLEIEPEYEYGMDGLSSIHYFYPVKGKDTESGYESVCYISPQSYLGDCIGTKIRISV